MRRVPDPAGRSADGYAGSVTWLAKGPAAGTMNGNAADGGFDRRGGTMDDM